MFNDPLESNSKPRTTKIEPVIMNTDDKKDNKDKKDIKYDKDSMNKQEKESCDILPNSKLIEKISSLLSGDQFDTKHSLLANDSMTVAKHDDYDNQQSESCHHDDALNNACDGNNLNNEHEKIISTNDEFGQTRSSSNDKKSEMSSSNDSNNMAIIKDQKIYQENKSIVVENVVKNIII